MQLENTFSIAVPLDQAWAAFNDPETVAPCFPGAALTDYTGDSFTGNVKVKLGPISLSYKGKGTYVERDDAHHRVVIDASGRDARGNGTASAKVTGTMRADGPDRTEITMVTDMTITGRPAQFGRGVMSDVADKIIGQFSACLAANLTGEEKATEPTPLGRTEATPSRPAPSTATGSTTGSTTPIKPPPRAGVEAINLLDAAGAPVLQRLGPILGVVAVMTLIVLALRGLRSTT